jgi:hypothetical protein
VAIPPSITKGNNMKNKRMAIKAIKEDCQIRCRYINKKGDTCAIGKLALLAGVRRSVLRKLGSDRISEEVCNAVSSAITRKFGLDASNQDRIQILNDHNNTIKSRRNSIVNYLETL